MRAKIGIIFSVVVAFAACKSSDSFVLNGQVENPSSIKKVFLLENDTAGRPIVIDSAALSDQNKFSFKHATTYPNLYKLKVGGTVFDLIAKNGDDITFKTNALDTTNKYEISGSMDSEKIQEFNKMGNKYAKITEKILEEYNYKTKTLNLPSAPLFAEAKTRYEKNQKDYNAEVSKFMDDNKASLAGFYASTALDPTMYEIELIKYSDYVKGKFAGNTAVEQFVKKMELAKPVAIGHKAPEFRLMDFDYKPVTVSDYRGKYLMIDFWASWCAPCRQENPNVVKLYAQFKDKGLNILGISLDENRIDWQKAIEADHLTWRHASELKNFNGPVVKLYRVEGIPANFIIGPDGTIVAKNLRGADLEEFFKKTFNK